MFQVITGGNSDVDVVLKNPSGHILYKQEKEEYDQIELEVEEPGVYEFCFSNEFSTFSRKIIYMGSSTKHKKMSTWLVFFTYFFFKNG